MQEGPEVFGRAALARARALVRVAARSAEALERRDLLRRPAVLLRAAELVRGGAPAGFEPSAVHIYGFADATGVATDLVEALLDRHRRLSTWIDHRTRRSPRASRPARFSAAAFANVWPTARRSRRRAGDERKAAPGAVIEAFRALGAGAEAREVARRLRALLDGGARPEGLGVVARRLDGYLSPLRVQCRRYGVPFSGLAARGPVTPDGRTVGALLDLLRMGRRAPLERWLDARREPLDQTTSFDLRLALHSLGAARLEDLQQLPLRR